MFDEPDELRRMGIPADAGRPIPPATASTAAATSRPSPTEPRPSRRSMVRARVRRALGRARRSAPFVGGIVAAFVAIWIYGALNPPKPPLTTRAVSTAIASALASQVPPPPRSELVYAAIQPSLVVIQTDGPPRARARRARGRARPPIIASAAASSSTTPGS